MSQKVTILAQAKDGPCSVAGSVLWLKIGERNVKLFVQDEPDYLLDYRSGFRIPAVRGGQGTLNEKRVFLLATSMPGARLSDRFIASQMIADAVAMVGAERVLEVLDKAEALNP